MTICNRPDHKQTTAGCLEREQNIYGGLLNQPPAYPEY